MASKLGETNTDESATLSELGPDQLRVLNTLVIVDNLSMFAIFQTVLEGLGIRNVVHQRTTQGVVETLLSQPIDLVVIDDLSPLDGVKFLATLRKGTGKLPNAVPVMFVTAVAERERIVAARDAGANEVMLKSFIAAQLRARLETTVKKPRTFVESNAYISPDRRRRRDDGTAAERRGKNRGDHRDRRESKDPALRD